MNLLQTLEQEQLEKLKAQRGVPRFDPGDTVRVSVKVVEGERERIQAFEGVCIARKRCRHDLARDRVDNLPRDAAGPPRLFARRQGDE